MYALIALGYTLVYGVLQLINFAHSEVFMSGAFGSYLVVHRIVGPAAAERRSGCPASSLVGLLSGALARRGIAWVLERVAYRPLRQTRGPKLAFLISAIGASFFLSQLAGKLFNRLREQRLPGVLQTEPEAVHASFGARSSVLQVDHHRRRGGHDALPRPAGLGHQARAAASAASPRTRRPRR